MESGKAAERSEIVERRTKIVCTLGPAVASEEKLEQLILAGMNVARFNFSHGDHDSHRAMYEMLDRVRARLGMPVATLLDTRGPEIRLGLIEGGKLRVEAGDVLVLTPEEITGNQNRISISHKTLYQDVSAGTRILIDDGLIELRVIDIQGEDIHCRVINAGPISNRKGINVPGIRLSLPYLSEQDERDIRFGVQIGFDYIAASFVNSPADILSIRKLLDEQHCHSIRIIAKIESVRGVDNIDEILKVSDGVMVARGDMGVEIPLEEVPIIQKALIKKTFRMGKNVITATQMLESMTQNLRPTRAEAADVANAIYDGTSAVMLSGETASGLYPVEAARTMATIAWRTEKDINYRRRMETGAIGESRSELTSAIAHATCATAHDLNAAAIITVTHSGQTARAISSFRPGVPIIGCTANPATYRHLCLSWGVTPVMIDYHDTDSETLFSAAVEEAHRMQLVADGDLVVITAGIPIGIPGTTNLLKVHVVSDILATGQGIGKGSATGRLCVVSDESEARARFTPGDILVIPRTSNTMMDILRNCAGLITEEGGANSHGAVVGLTLDIPTIVGVMNSVKLLKSDICVVLDASRGVVAASGRQTKKDRP
jgi:pyruvate kinase